jgi:uncharacterized linocin/CFP29 family protein
VAARFLPLYGPLPADTDYVSKDRVDESANPLTIDDTTTIPVPTLQVKVTVRGAQMADPELTSVLQLFRRAANMLARLEDALVFRGKPANATEGLLDTARRKVDVQATGDSLVTRVSESIGDLEGVGHFGPFAVVLGKDLFKDVQTPNASSLVLPHDRIIPFLEGGPLLRSTLLPDDQGIVVALGGSPVELVVATDMSLNFLQVTTHPMFVFRVYEKVVLRIKEPRAIMRLERASQAVRTRSRAPASTQTP